MKSNIESTGGGGGVIQGLYCTGKTGIIAPKIPVMENKGNFEFCVLKFKIICF